MTDAERIEQVEQALDGTRELIAEVRELAGTFEYSTRGRDAFGKCSYGPVPATLAEARDRMMGLLEREECDLWNHAVRVLGADALYKIYVEELLRAQRLMRGKP